MLNKFFKFCVVGFLPFLMGCDLQPKITALPDNVSEFIATRYPALLADPTTNPEIYESAAMDYGFYASPSLYGNESIDDYVLYASPNDYVYVPETSVESGEPILVQRKAADVEKVKIDDKYIAKPDADDYLVVPMYGGVKIADKYKDFEKQDSITNLADSDKEITVVKGDTLYSLSKKHFMKTEDLAKINNLKEPYILSIGQKLKIEKSISTVPVVVTVDEAKLAKIESSKDLENKNTAMVMLKEITVAKGDTLYSISRRYLIPVNDLAVLNKLSPPFTLSVGKKIKVPAVTPVSYTNPEYAKKFEKPSTTSTTKTTVSKTTATQKATAKTTSQKISSDPAKKLPTLTSRSSSKFSWPVRGKTLSSYGPKSGGLFNDGINLSANLGTPVRAAENGAVAYAGNEVKGMGNLVIIQHSDGWMTVYAHMDKMSVRRGTKVNVGQQIGTIGKTGKVSVPQLHFEIRKGSKAYDPMKYLKK